MKKIYDQILHVAIAHKPWIKQFWDSADNTKSGFKTNGVVIGQTWDGPAISMKKAGNPVSYQAPKEGAIGWVDGFAIVKGAKNIDQAYEWLKYTHTARGFRGGGRTFGLQSVRHRGGQAVVRQGAHDLQRGLSRQVDRQHVVAPGRADLVRRPCAPNMRRSSRRRERAAQPWRRCEPRGARRSLCYARLTRNAPLPWQRGRSAIEIAQP